MDWEIGANLGRRSRVGVKARGWAVADHPPGIGCVRLLIEIRASAQSTDPVEVRDDTRPAIEMNGRTELLPARDLRAARTVARRSRASINAVT
jgi:hypothetical protein